MSSPSLDYPKHHPTGLWVLFTTEMWERFAFYAMRAILVLYLVDLSTNPRTPGFSWSESDAYRLYGIYTGLVYLLPLLGGWIADRFLGQHRCVLLGGILMALGEFCLAGTELIRIGGGTKITWASDPLALSVFYAGLALMVIGNGFFKPCISVMVGQLYAPGDKKRDAAFSIFYMGINIGAFFSPLVAGTLAEKYGYHLGFLVAGFGMIFGVISFTLFRARYLKGIGLPPKMPQPGVVLTPEESKAHEQAEYERTRPLIKQDWDRMYVIIVLSLFVIAFWVSFEQAGSSLNTFAKSRTDRNFHERLLRMTPDRLSASLLIKDEYAIDLSVAVGEVHALEESIKKILEGKKESEQTLLVQRDTFAERWKKLFSFDSGKQEEEISTDERIQALLRRVDERPNDPIYQQQLLHLVGTRLSSSEWAELSGLLSKYRDKVEEMQKQNERALSLYQPKTTILTFPASWYQSVNAFGIVIFAPLFTLLWFGLAKYGIEPSTPMKFALGLILLSIGFFLMIPGAIEAKQTHGNAGPHWLIWCYLFSTWGELCVSPVGLSMVTKLAPARYGSFFMGVWFFASSTAYFLAGELAALFGAGDGVTIVFGPASGLADFFLLMGIIPLVIGLIALTLAPTLKRMMHGIS